jgi:tetratricopeptide (TPR) repeat protein
MINQFRMIIVFTSFVLIFSSEIFCQSTSELIQSGLGSYQNGDYQSALNSFNNALQVSGSEDNDLPLTGESQEVDDSESQEVDDSESKEVDDSESQETYTGESQIQTADVSTIQQYSDPLKYVGEEPADVYLYRGQTNLKLGNQAAAVSDFDKAISLDPSYSDAYFRRAIANYKVNPDKVCPDLQTAIDNGHKSAQELYDLICK